MELEDLSQEGQDENFEGSKEVEKPNAQPSKSYSSEERRLATLFFTALEPYELRKHSELDTVVPEDLGERLLDAFETFNESFRLFLKDLGYFEKEVIYDLILKLLAEKINSTGNGETGTLTKNRYRGYFEYYYAQLEKLKPNVRFNLSWNKHNKYFLPLVVESLCETKIIAESSRTALDAFQFIFPKEKLQKVNTDNAARSAFIAEDPKVFINGLEALLEDIRSNLMTRQEERRKLLNSKKSKKQTT